MRRIGVLPSVALSASVAVRQHRMLFSTVSGKSFMGAQVRRRSSARAWRMMSRSARAQALSASMLESEVPKRNDALRHQAAHANTGYNVLMKALYQPPFPKDFFTGEMAANVAKATLAELKTSPKGLRAFQRKFQRKVSAAKLPQRANRPMKKWNAAAAAQDTKVPCLYANLAAHNTGPMKKWNAAAAAQDTKALCLYANLAAHNTFSAMLEAEFGHFTAQRMFAILGVARGKMTFTPDKYPRFEAKFDGLPDLNKRKYLPLIRSAQEKEAFSAFCAQNATRYTVTTFSILDLFAAFRGAGWVLTAKESNPTRDAAYWSLLSADKTGFLGPAKVLTTLTKVDTMKFAVTGKAAAPPLVLPAMYRPTRNPEVFSDVLRESDFVQSVMAKRGDRSVYAAVLAETARYYSREQQKLLLIAEDGSSK